MGGVELVLKLEPFGGKKWIRQVALLMLLNLIVRDVFFCWCFLQNVQISSGTGSEISFHLFLCLFSNATQCCAIM